MAKASKKVTKKSATKVAKVVKAPKVVAVKVPKAPACTTNKSGIIASASIAAGITGAQGKAYYEALTEGAYTNMKKNGSFVLPGFAKFTVKKKAATKARKGTLGV